MIISRKHRFAFIHIPKCAGSSVREPLQPLDDCPEPFYGVHDHPELGSIDRGHLLLSVLRQYFPTEFELLQAYQSFAVLRNPSERFPSSMSQHLMMNGDKPIEDLAAPELYPRIDAVVAALESKPADFLPLELTHFHQQRRYVYVGGEQVIKNLYRTDDMAALWRDIAAILPVTVPGARRKNGALFYKDTLDGKLAGMVTPTAARYFRDVIPARVVAWVKRSMYVTRDQRWSDVFNSPDVQKFVLSYYKEDFDLYESLAGARP